MKKEKLDKIVVDELERIGIVRKEEVERTHLYKLKAAYPMYPLGYKEKRQKIMEYAEGIKGLYLTGRAGSFHYTNMDESVEMGRKTAEKIIQDTSKG